MRLGDSRLYIGFNPYAGTPLAYREFEFDLRELDSLAALGTRLAAALPSALAAAGVPADAADFAPPPDCGPGALFAHGWAQAMLALQRAAGHRVAYAGVLAEGDAQRVVALAGFEALEVGVQAGALALACVGACWSALEAGMPVPDPDAAPEAGEEAPLAERVAAFLAFARPLALPADTAALIAAASRADVPVLKMDRYPFAAPGGSFRIRPNGLLKLGHGRHQHIVDGTFCVDRSNAFAPLLRERTRVLGLLARLGLPVPRQDDGGSCTTLGRAQRAAARIGYPLVLRPLLRERGDAPPRVIRNAPELEPEWARLRVAGRRVQPEAWVEGEAWRVLVANGRPLAVLAGEPGRTTVVTARAHPALLEAAARVAAAIDVGLFVLTLRSRDVACAPGDGGAAFVELDVAPELDGLLPPGSLLLAAAADAFLAWLFPPGTPARVPLVATTGTNGKTTTSRMVAAVLRAAGFTTGLACTDGVYLDDEPLVSGDSAGLAGHYRLLEHPRLGAASLETARGGVLTAGIGYDRCDVAMCLNVSADHLGERGIETLEQMAALKRRVVERASAAAVLNADDALCLAMAPGLGARRLCLVSLRRSAAELAGAHARADCFAVLEDVAGSEWLVLHDAGRRVPLLPATEIPATFGALVRYNVANALHAAAACHLAGVDPTAIRAGLAGFRMGFDTTPGRLNFVDGLPYRLLLDFAHNPEGIARLCEFTDRVPVGGRRILALSAPGHNPVPDVAGNARSAAGHFDHYICYNYQRNVNNGHDHVPRVLADTLRDCGVPERCIEVVELELDVLEALLRLARPGDFVVFLSGVSNRPAVWARLAEVQRSYRDGDQSPSVTSSLQ